MRSSAPLVLVAWLAAAPPAPGQTASPPQVELIERIVAVVDGRPLLLSDVRALMAVRGLDEKKAEEEAIDERLMYAEAMRLPQADVRPEEVDRALATLRGTKPGAARVPEPDLRRLLVRQLATFKYIEFRFRPQIRVPDEEVRRVWEEEQAGRPAGPALEDEQQAIRARLERRALDERIEAWVKELRARADVRYVEPEPSPGP
jgi:hypothetical protein